MGGDQRPLGPVERRVLARRVRQVERRTGLQVVVHVGGTPEHPRAFAERLLADHHAHAVVVLLVDPVKRHVELRTTGPARRRLSDEHAAEVVRRMEPGLAGGRLARGVVHGLRVLEVRAGRGRRGALDLPEITGGTEGETGRPDVR